MKPNRSVCRESVVVFLLLLGWIVWQCWGIEIMRPPWEDETAYTLPGTNWVQGQGFKIPQWTGFAQSEQGWRWHMPLFSTLIALWQKCFGISLLSIRLYTLLPAAAALVILACFCRALTGRKSITSLLFWLALVGTDKVFATNSVMGRMEIHAVLFVLLSFGAVLMLHKPWSAFAAGLLLALGSGFHPLAGFFGPALAGLIWWRTVPIHRRQAIFSLGAGFAIPTLAYLFWFGADWPLTKSQFFTAARQSGAPLMESAHAIVRAFQYCYRTQPAFEVATLGAFALIAAQFIWKLLPETQRWLRYVIVLALAGYLAFLLRGSASHYYNYVGVTVLLYCLIAWAIGRLFATSQRFRTFALVAMGLLLLNNIGFAIGKTHLVWKDGDLSDPAAMATFLTNQTRAAKRIVVPPNLWLFASQNRWNYRLVYTPVVNTSADVRDAYHVQLLAWKPDVIILDMNMLPPFRGSLSPEEVEEAGYVKTGEFSRMFRNRFDPYPGYELVVYRKQELLSNGYSPFR